MAGRRIIYQVMQDRTTCRIQSRQGGISLWLVLAFLLPLLLALLPAPALSGAAVLDRDLSESICALPGEDGETPDHAGHDDCCILCPSGASAGVTLKAPPHIIVPPARIAFGAGVIADRAIPVHRIDLKQIVPRGPPAA
jgi:hypothetical protein